MRFFCLLVLLVVALADYRRFDGHKVLRCKFDFSNTQHAKFYQSLIDEDREEVDLWGRNDIHLTPQSISRISSALEVHGIPCYTMIEDLQTLVDNERIPSEPEPNAPNPDPFFNNYQTLDAINDWYRTQATANQGIATFTALGTTYQNRTTYLFKVTNGGNFGTKRVIFFHGGIHAREWISHATTAYLLGKLLNKSDTDAVNFLNKYEIQIVPVVNGDGYNYTWTTDRNWRKTRKPNAGSTCVGTDPNRNWDDHWCQQGGSTSACSDSYCGSAPFTEKETKLMADQILAIQRTQTLSLYIDWHAYGQLWMAPWGWTSAAPPNSANLRTVGTAATAAIRAFNNNASSSVYQYGSINTIIYPASGSSVDYATTNGVAYAYGVELRDTGTYGFTLPASQIRPQGEEIWAAMVAIYKNLP